MREYAQWLYSSAAWDACRTAYRKQVGGLCEVCAAKGLIVPGEIVHHKIHINQKNIHDPNVTLNPENLQLVCRDCHAEIHKRKKRYKVDKMGHVQIPILQ